MDNVVDRVQISTCICVSEIAIYALFQSSIETFDHCRLDVVIFTRVEMNIVSQQHRLKRSIHIFRTFVRLIGVDVDTNTPTRTRAHTHTHHFVCAYARN